MARIFNSYEKPFIVDESKLRRIVTLINEGFAEAKSTPKYKFEVFTKGHRNYTFNDIEELFSLDNSKKERIKNLFITCIHGDDEKAERSQENQVDVHFHGEFLSKMCLDVRNDNAKWANELNSVLDEQMDRMIQSGVMTRIVHMIWPIVVLILFVVLIAMMALVLINSGSSSITLAYEDINQVERTLSNSSSTDQEKADKIF